MARKIFEVVFIGNNFHMVCDDLCFGGNGAEDAGQMGCKV
jgi:hypothetical protein